MTSSRFVVREGPGYAAKAQAVRAAIAFRMQATGLGRYLLYSRYGCMPSTHGVDHYGLYPDWIEDLRLVAGPQIVNDMANGAEAYLRMWSRAQAAAGP